jgi:hypothetical protein
MEIYIPGYGQEVEQILKESPDASIGSYQPQVLKDVVLDLEQSGEGLLDKMFQFKRWRRMFAVPGATVMSYSKGLELVYDNDDARRYGNGKMEFQRIHKSYRGLPDTFPKMSSLNITLGWHTDQETLPKIKELVEENLSTKDMLKTQYFIHAGKLGKIIDLPLEIEDPRLQVLYKRESGPKRFVVPTRPLDYALCAVALNQFNNALDFLSSSLN